jgi:ribosomal-protein-serine acetyltransferase
MVIKLDDTLILETIAEKHAQPMFDLINSSRQHLREWLPWVDHMQTVENFEDHIADCKRREDVESDFAFVILLEDQMAGRIGIHYINYQNKIASIGYWLGDGYQGKGIITKACIALIDYSFHVLEMNRVQIKCATGNFKSQAIPERLNFKKEGIIRQGEFVNGRFVDLYLYSILKEEFKR